MTWLMPNFFITRSIPLTAVKMSPWPTPSPDCLTQPAKRWEITSKPQFILPTHHLKPMGRQSFMTELHILHPV